MAEFLFDFDEPLPLGADPTNRINREPAPVEVITLSTDNIDTYIEEKLQEKKNVADKAAELQRLYTKGKLGELRFWEVAAVGDKVVTVYGVVDGKAVRVERKAKPKNVGRANATTAEQQAVKEAAADHKFMLDRKYSLTPEDARETVPLPMLANKFKDAKKITFPVDVQRKYDGVRAMARWNGEKVELISRQGKLWERVPHLNEALETILPKGSEFDGEIYLHGMSLQQIGSVAKDLDHPDNPNLTYQVYDMPTFAGDDTMPWSKRRVELESEFGMLELKDLNGPIKLVETFTAENAAQVQELHDRFVKEGYEGAIVRILTGLYEYGYRSNFLLKLKAFDDTEFEIIGFKESEGEPGLVKWICRNDINDLTFETRPRGTHKDRRWLFQHGAEFVGKKLTVVHFGRYDSGLPHFPIGKAIRVEEDL